MTAHVHHWLSRALAEEEGVSLIELLVSILAGMIVIIALFNLQIVTLHQTTRVFTKVDATQHARVAIEDLENELHSACIVDNVTPVQSGSSPTSLQFVSQEGNGATLTPVEHVIAYNSTAGSITTTSGVFNYGAQTLTDSTYAETGETQNSSGEPVYTFASTASTARILLANVTQSGTIPIFQYYAYQVPMNGSTPYTDASGYDYEMLLDGTSEVPGTSTIPTASPLTATPSLGSTNAANTAEVVTTVTVAPYNTSGENTNLSDASDTVSDGVVLRLTPAPNHTGAGNAFIPCQ
jgi:Tfp pilus assembly protein PilW